MSDTIVAACDPGLEGAFCVQDWKSGRLEVFEMPVHWTIPAKGKQRKRQTVDEVGVLQLMMSFHEQGVKMLFLEQVGGIPGQSAPAAFNFGVGFGIVRCAALACNIGIELVPPATWKGALRVPKDKKLARARASEMLPMFRNLWPMAKDDGKAEAAMLALYGERCLKGDTFTKRTPAQQRDVDASMASIKRKRDQIEARKAASRARRTNMEAAIKSDADPDLAASLF